MSLNISLLLTNAGFNISSVEVLGTLSTHLQTLEETPSQSADQYSQIHEVLLPAPLSPVIMQAYYRIQTRTPGGAIRCLT